MRPQRRRSLITTFRSGHDRKMLVWRTANTTGREANMRMSWSVPKRMSAVVAGRSVARPMTMRWLLWAIALISISQPTKPAYSTDEPPAWAYPITPPDFKLPLDDGQLKHVPDSSAAFTITQLRDRFL